MRGDDEDADDNGEELLSLLANMATSEDDSMTEDVHGNETDKHGMIDEVATETEIELECHENADELAACAAPTEDTKAAEEVHLMSEVTKARVEDDGSESTLSR